MPGIGDQPGGLARAVVGRDGHGVRGHHVGGGGGGGLVQAVLEPPERLEEDDAPEELDVVRDVEVALVVGEDQVRFRDDSLQLPVTVDDGHARELVLAERLHDLLDGGIRMHGHRVRGHDLAYQ